MLKKLVVVFLCAVIALVLAGCPNPTGGGPSSDDETPTAGTVNVPQFFWGSWLGIGSEGQWYIADTSVRVDGNEVELAAATSTELSIGDGRLEKDSDNVLKYYESGSTIPQYLYRSQGPSSSFNAAVTDSGASGSVHGRNVLSGVAGIEVVIENVNNPSNRREVTSGSDGSVVADEVIVGDSYTITVPQQDGVPSEVGATVTPVYDGQDLGVMDLLNTGANFKMNLELGDDMRPDLLYADGTTVYPVTVTISNIGNADLDEANYSIRALDGLEIAEGAAASILGTVFQGSSQEIEIGLRCPPITGEYADKTVEIEITNVDASRTWTDRISLRFLKEVDTFTIDAAAWNQVDGVTGLVVDPEGIPTRIIGPGSTSFPWKPGDYVVVFGGSGTGTETRYSIGVDTTAATDWDSLTTTAHGEPNNSPEEPTSLTYPGSDMQYLGAKDVDFYAFTLPVAGAFSPASGATVADTTPTFDWNDIAGAVAYEIQIAETEAGLADSSPFTVTESTFTPTEAVTNNKTHYWRLRAVDSAGQSFAWSAIYSVAVNWGSISRMRPSDGAMADPTPELAWDAVVDATEFELRYGATAAGAEGATPVVLMGNTYEYPTEISVGEEVHWQVRAKNAEGQYGAWSTLQSMVLVGPPSIGHTGPAGGVVFFDKGSYSDGWRFLEAAPSDQSPGIEWGELWTDIEGLGQAIGTGEANTETIVASLGAGSYAARICYDLSLGGYEDWFLPSRGELSELYEQRSTVGGFASGPASPYWSSSGGTYGTAIVQYFNQDMVEEQDKNSNQRVRAIRQF